ncbi:MAG: site-specific integrase [Symploca sp. SIO1B1]|nr:site-specific integrase [Symploca sp. SIO1B1]
MRGQISPHGLTSAQQLDFRVSVDFLLAYEGSLGTFNSYRREVERLLQWVWRVKSNSLKDISRKEIEEYLSFCKKPPKTWIGLRKYRRFISQDGVRVPNSKWRPFVATVSKVAYRNGERPDKKAFELSPDSTRELFAILSSFFGYLLSEEYVQISPVALIRQKSKYIQRRQSLPKIRRLSNASWQTIIESTRELAEDQPERYERSLFIVTALYAMYLRISEVAASERWTPTMNDFGKDESDNWWFTTVGKGNKMRQIAVSDAMLLGLKRWRRYLGLSSLPSPADSSPLVPKLRGNGPVTSSDYVRELVQECFDRAVEALRDDGKDEDAEVLAEATVHWLRHTGISEDVKRRPREHVRDDAGHSSSAITDKYIDVELHERHKSAKRKPLS